MAPLEGFLVPAKGEKEAPFGKPNGALRLSRRPGLRSRKAPLNSLLAKYHPDKVQHLGVEFGRLAQERTRVILEAREYFKKKYGE